MSASRFERANDAAAWWLIAAMALVCALAMSGQGFTFALPQSLLPIVGAAILCAAMIIGRVRNRPSLSAGAGALLRMTVFTLLGVILSYALAARAGTLWDARFRAIDEAMGFDWPFLFAAADRFPAALWLGGLAYHSLTLQMVACILVLSATRQTDRLRIAVTAAIVSGFATILISGVTPALGNVFDPDRYRHLWPSVAWREQEMLAGLRDGSWRIIDLTQMMGIVTFPSYHATLPILLAWAVGRTRWCRVIAPVWATVTIVATPLFGGHYAIDVLAGIGLAVLALWGTLAVMSVPIKPYVSMRRVPGSLMPVVRSDRRWPAARCALQEERSGADNALV
jgi:hypothetical protein